MGETTTYGVHLFHDTRLVASLRTADVDQASYLIDGVTYTVTGRHGPYLEDGSSGEQAWDLQVEPTNPAGTP